MIFWSFFNKIDSEHSAAWRKVLLLTFGLSLAFNLVLWLLLLRSVADFTAIIPIHYDIYFGINALGPGYRLLIIPGFGLAVILLNFSLAFLFFSRERILSYFLLWSSLLIQLILLLAAAAIVVFLA